MFHLLLLRINPGSVCSKARTNTPNAPLSQNAIYHRLVLCGFFNRPVVRILYTPNALATGWHLVPEYEKELAQRRHSFCDLVATANWVLGSRNPQNTR